MLRRAGLALVAGVLAAGSPAPYAAAQDDPGPAAGRAQPLAGRTVVLDAGHQLGNQRYPRQTTRLVPAGGFRKPCNTTGTETATGVAETTVNWRVTRLLQRRLEALGARVVLTRTSNRLDRWGPCVDARGRAGNRIGADLKLSIHADGAAPGQRGFHVVTPTSRPRWTRDIARPSRRLAVAVRSGLQGRSFRTVPYVAGGIDRRGDLATLNLSDVPAVVVELGNLRDRRDARLLTSPRGQARAAAGLLAGVRRFLG
ncbi:N-acetylmuramoyl-L-alanine amidase [Nocardioides coralli]|uniref:N-acetylmuramoyl-L-alanine amidase n=1 Tax=Nocardioides coralli TaxID=2872154 RepID=UPI001CA3AA0C|nr:N-acetylmuramoyl-L-alanine amidase [Nocardioides coralli]QZY28764.1 N-acetylmuramoyl-L-alanine amidase [Nocardioides coralli]